MDVQGRLVPKNHIFVHPDESAPGEGPSSPISLTVVPQQEKLTQYLKFLHLANYLDLIGDFDSVHKAIFSTIQQNRQECVTSKHIHLIMDLPNEHPVRIFLIQALAWLCVENLMGNAEFRFREEVDEMDELAAEVLRESLRAFAAKITPSHYGHFEITPPPASGRKAGDTLCIGAMYHRPNQPYPPAP